VLIDFASARKKLSRTQLSTLDDSLRAMVFGYDVLVVLPKLHNTQPIVSLERIQTIMSGAESAP
jgi:hypothetical protein